MAANKARRMLRYVVFVDDRPKSHLLAGDPRHVAAARLGVGSDAQHFVEFWVEADLDSHDAERERKFQVFGTGQALPDGARWWGTTGRTIEGLVWHLFELPVT